jgi:hypothetical protein
LAPAAKALANAEAAALGPSEEFSLTMRRFHAPVADATGCVRIRTRAARRGRK